MVFASTVFLWTFLPSVLCLYGIAELNGKQGLKNFLLLFASLFFYSFGEPKHILLLILCTLVNYAGGIVIDWAIRDEKENIKKITLFLVIFLNLALLGYYKYANFAIDLLNGMFSREVVEPRGIVLPIGISFYTFQAMSYSIDTYRGRCAVQKSFWKLLLYISFFPQLIAGPIVRYRDVQEQIDHRKVDLETFTEGVRRFSEGLAKKIVLANTFAERADYVFSLLSTERDPKSAWYGLFLYSLQIYFDFSGYSDMAIGLGKMFGFHFQENFNYPYISASVSEFWRRWHISLSGWLREYLYIPLGGNRKGLIRTCANLLFVFLITGLWHGAGGTFIIWGLIHGALVVVERIFKARSNSANKRKTACLQCVFGHVGTIFAVMLAWVFFRSESLTEAFSYLRSLFPLWGADFIRRNGFREIFGMKCILLSLASIPICAGIPNYLRKRMEEAMPSVYAIVMPLVIGMELLLSMLLLASDSYNPFIYFRF